MKFHIVRHSEIDAIRERHPVIAEQKPDLVQLLLPHVAQENPDFPCVFYAEEDGQLACYMRSFPDTLVHNGQDIPIAWNGNLMTLPDFRRRGLAQALVKKQLEEFERMGVVWAGVFSSPGALRLYEKLSFTMAGACPRLCLVRNVTPFLKHHVPNPIAKVIGALGKVSSRTLNLIMRTRNPYRGRMRLEKISSAEFAQIPTANFSHTDATCYWDGTPSWVLYRQASRNIDDIFLVYTDQDTKPCGYVLLRQRKNLSRPIREKYYGVETLTLTHYGAFNTKPDVPEQLLAATLDYFWRGDADMLDIVTSNPALIHAARQAGMMPLGNGMSYKFKEPSAFQNQLPRDIKAYKLTHYNGDAFNFE